MLLDLVLNLGPHVSAIQNTYICVCLTLSNWPSIYTECLCFSLIEKHAISLCASVYLFLK